MDLTKIAHRIASKISHVSAYTGMEVANMETNENAYEIVVKAGKLRGVSRTWYGSTPEEAQAEFDERLDAGGWEEANIEWVGRDEAKKVLGGNSGWFNYEKRFESELGNGIEIVKINQIGS